MKHVLCIIVYFNESGQQFKHSKQDSYYKGKIIHSENLVNDNCETETKKKTSNIVYLTGQSVG